MNKYVSLLSRMIATPSFSKEESDVADLLADFLIGEGLAVSRIGNNIIADYPETQADDARPVLLLNSHMDTVRPVDSWTRQPFVPTLEPDGRLYGLGSNDAGASVVSLVAAFLALRAEQTSLPVRLRLALSAQEECSGPGGFRALLTELGRADMALVGEPTAMDAAVGERGLLVFDCVAHGKSGHAARADGINAIDIAVADIIALKNLSLPISDALGPIKITPTQIEAGYRHNVVPDTCRWVIDVRTTDALSNLQTVAAIQAAIRSDASPRSTHIQASAIAADHPLVRAAVAAGAKTFCSPTTSDMALMPFPSLKMGPGNSARSHAADEFITIDEINDAINKYIATIKNIKL